MEVKFVKWLDDVIFDEEIIPPLDEIPAGSSKEVSVEWPVDPDYFDIEVDVDPHNNIRELKEDNI